MSAQSVSSLGQRFSLGLDSFSYYLHWRYDNQAIDTLLDRVTALDLTALQININGPNHRALSGSTTEHFRSVGSRAAELGIALEIASGGTDPSKMLLVLEMARNLDADVVRTTIDERGDDIGATLKQQAARISLVAEQYEAADVSLAVENHEDLTASELVELLQLVDSPAVGAVFDSGNSIPFYQDPIEEARLLAPHARTTHIKDHVLVRDNDGEVWSTGVALGSGRIPLTEIVEVLAAAPHLERLMIQVCYGYATKMPKPPQCVPDMPLYEIITTPEDTGIRLPSQEVTQDVLETAARHVESSVEFMRELTTE